MSVIVGRGIARDGQVIIAAPLNVPDGTEVFVTTGGLDAEAGSDDWDDSPEGVAAWLRWYDSLQPLIYTDEEKAAWEAARREQKAWEIAHFDENAERLRRMWE